mmetsp:Transcript_124081/g.247162  ORF Transcript_124081/g.247162 Transcript_124081/m.247162 type:complete len:402 (-) Transcript_124081:145-1350(-)|eukprot:CAMPEP_0172656366 /NCGR_PEP_ID=MMETSP1074-20121228/1329_1 /TAXON_ID=2916 /ORGANISM="Ceratium fusus, Strain PA161109" /LENGTH=401 /DNA_ID=CAMNT_0013471203 /DNA_START=35 /DNA_END=1240 /DNA_ORIENTATION=-
MVARSARKLQQVATSCLQRVPARVKWRPTSYRKEATSDEKADIIRLKAMIGCGLASVAGLTWLGSKVLAVGQDEAEAVWFGERGPISTERTVAVLPMGMCIGSGCVAAAAAYLRPRQITHLALPSQVHEVIGLPMSIFLAFRFQNSYQRWWNSRQMIEDMASSVVMLATGASMALPSAEGAECLVPDCNSSVNREAREIRSRILALTEAYLGYAEMRIHGDNDEDLNPEDVQVEWSSPEEALADWPEDAAAAKSTLDPTMYCSAAITACLLRLEGMGAVTGDWAGPMYAQISSLQQALGQCIMVSTQLSPCPFVVHVRTLLLAFCFSFPFTIIHKVHPAFLVPIQGAVSLAFLGTEFCSRQMEHPFGSDSDDVPVRSIMHKALKRVHEARCLATLEASVAA